MRTGIRVAVFCIAVANLVGQSSARAEELPGYTQSAEMSQIDQVVAYSSEYADETPLAGLDADSSAAQDPGESCEDSDNLCQNDYGDQGLPLDASNDAMIWQGFLNNPCTDCVVNLAQYGFNNSIQIEQDGIGNTVSARQDGDSNYMHGLQSGLHNFIGINQFHSGNFADIRQYGNDHSITVTQPGDGFIVITQE